MSRSPDYILKAMNKRTGDKGRIGVAWKNPNGSIGIVLNHQVTITAGPDLVLNLFPKDDEAEEEQQPDES